MNIFLKPDEEIVSIVDKLIQSSDEQINLIIPAGAQLWQSSINLKLLKREADYLNKQVVLVVADNLSAEIAEKAGFKTKQEKDLEVQTISDEMEPEEQPEEFELEEDVLEEDNVLDNSKKPDINSENDIIGKLVEELDSPEKVNKFKKFISKPKKEKRINFASAKLRGKKARVEDKRMTDIITPISPQKEKSIPKKTPQPSFSESDMDVLKPRQEKTKRKFSFGWLKILIGIILFGLIGAGVWFYRVMPTTEINLKTTEEKVTFDLSATGSVNVSEVDAEKNLIPLQVIEVSKTKNREFQATGEEQLNQKARGFITVYNAYSSAPQTLVAITRFKSPEGKIFRIPKSVTVPGAEIKEGKIIPSSIKVEVIADQPGADYNIEATNFTIPGFKGSPKYAGFYGESKSAMTGGSTEKVKVVTQEDIDQAEETLINEIKEGANQNFKEQIPEDLKLIKGAEKQETNILSTVESGTQTDKFLVEVEAKITALLYNQKDLEDLVSLNVADKVSENKVVLPKTQQIKWLEPKVDLEKGEVVFSLYAEEKVAYQLNLDQIKTDLLDLNEIQVRKYFADKDEVSEARISFRPFWAKSVSDNKDKIKILVENLSEE